MFCLTDSYDYEQLSFVEQISKVGDLSNKDPAKFIELLKNHFDISTFIPKPFYDSYYSSTTNDKNYSLESMLTILLLIHFFNFSSVPNFLFSLCFSPDLRSFCRLKDDLVPDQSLVSKFKTKYNSEIMGLFDNLAFHVMGIFTEYNDSLPDNSPLKGLSEQLIYDTTGLKPKVKENNPKTVESEIRRQSRYKSYLECKGDGKAKSFNVYSAAFANLPKHANANPLIKLGYANGHFGYFYKFGTLTNGFGIPLHIRFLDEGFYESLPSEFELPEEQKSAFDNASLSPVLSAFWKAKGANRFTTFLGDSEFDSYDNFSFLNQLGFSKVVIPINTRNSKPQSDNPIPKNEEGVPCCPKDTLLPFIFDGPCKGKNRSLRFKYVCPKSKRLKGNWASPCENKCRPTNSAVTTYVYPDGDLRFYSGVLRGSDEWASLYKRRTVIERHFSAMKSHPMIEKPRTHNCDSMRSDVFLNTSTKLITVILAFALGHVDYMKNLRKLLKAA